MKDFPLLIGYRSGHGAPTEAQICIEVAEDDYIIVIAVQANKGV